MDNPILRNEISPVHWTIVIKSLHYLAYRMWLRPPGGEWNKISEGTSEDGIADSGQFDSLADLELYYSFGIGSPQSNTKYDIAIVLTQDNVVLENGILQFQGSVGSSGVAAINGSITFKNSQQ